MAKKTPPPVKPADPAVTDRLMELVKDGFEHRAGIEEAERRGGLSQPPAAPAVVPKVSVASRETFPGPVTHSPMHAPAMPGETPMPRRQAKPLAKRQDPDYMPTSTYLLRHLVQRGKIAAAHMQVDFADVVNTALFDWLETFEGGLEGREE